MEWDVEDGGGEEESLTNGLCILDLEDVGWRRADGVVQVR